MQVRTFLRSTTAFSCALTLALAADFFFETAAFAGAGAGLGAGLGARFSARLGAGSGAGSGA